LTQLQIITVNITYVSMSHATETQHRLETVQVNT